MGKKVTRVNESQLREIIRKTINTYINNINKVEKSSKTERIYFNKNQVLQGIRNRWELNNSLNEGLMCSYSSERVRRMLLKKFDLGEDQVMIDSQETEDGTIDLISIVIPKCSTKDFIGNIQNTMNSFGYFQSNKEFIPYMGGDVYGVIVFEPKFTEDISLKIRKCCKYLYHCTDSVFIHKILQKGIIPMHKNSIYMFPDRVYCMKGDKLTQDQLGILYSIQQVHNNTMPQLENPKERLEYYLLTIDVNKLPQNIKMYSDPLSKSPIFTHDNIPPSAIVGIEPFTLTKKN